MRRTFLVRSGAGERAHRSLWWWYWLFTAFALAASLCGWKSGLAIAFALTAVQAVHVGASAGSAMAFPVQVRIGYLAIIALSAWTPLAPLQAVQLAGLLLRLAFDYCLLARMVSLLPWNRRGALTLERVRATFLTPPVEGTIVAALDRRSAR